MFGKKSVYTRTECRTTIVGCYSGIGVLVIAGLIIYILTNRNRSSYKPADMTGMILILFGMVALVASIVPMNRYGKALKYMDILKKDSLTQEEFQQMLQQEKGGPAAPQKQSAPAQQMPLRIADGYRYYACMRCGQMLRIPADSGAVKVTCPKCHTEFRA